MSTPRIQIYAWGANSHMQTGTNQPGVEELRVPTRVPLSEEIARLLDDDALVAGLTGSCGAAAIGGSTGRPPGGAGVAITGGGGHTVLLVAGHVFTCGLNDVGQLGRRTDSAADGVFRPVHVAEPVVSAACGWDHTLLLTASGRVLTAGSDRFGQRGLGRAAAAPPADPTPAALPLPGVTSHLAAGLRHSAAVTSRGQLLVWGDNSRGQLGVACERVVSAPRLLPTPAPVLDAACGQRHTVLLCGLHDSPRLYGMGDNSRGQVLKTPSSDCPAAPSLVQSPDDVTPARLPAPSLVQLPDDVTPRRVLCGWTHTLVHCANGRLRGWGRADYNQLTLPAAAVRRLSAGSEHAVAVSADGRLFAWGWDEHGAACGGLAPAPSQDGISDVTGAVAGRPVDVGAGYGCSFAVCVVDSDER